MFTETANNKILNKYTLLKTRVQNHLFSRFLNTFGLCKPKNNRIVSSLKHKPLSSHTNWSKRARRTQTSKRQTKREKYKRYRFSIVHVLHSKLLKKKKKGS